jgi:hypothetical protein
VDLYGLPPEQFTAARDAAAKEDKALKGLRRPTVSAWVVNTLTRNDPELLDDLADLGAELAEAQQQGRGDDLRNLAEQRKKLIATVTQRAVELVDRPIAPSARTEVEQTLEAVLSDPASAEAVRSGQLVRALSFAGFGGVDLEGAVAPLPRPDPAPKAKARAKSAARDTGAAERRALEAAGALDDAVRRAEAVTKTLEAAEQELAHAREAEQEADAATAQAQQAVLDAEAAAKAAHRRRIAAHKEHEALTRKAANVTKAVATAQDAADTARTALDKLRRG